MTAPVRGTDRTRATPTLRPDLCMNPSAAPFLLHLVVTLAVGTSLDLWGEPNERPLRWGLLAGASLLTAFWTSRTVTRQHAALEIVRAGLAEAAATPGANARLPTVPDPQVAAVCAAGNQLLDRLQAMLQEVRQRGETLIENASWIQDAARQVATTSR